MSKNITQKIIFRNTSPKTLYDLYMNAKKHAMISGAPAKITSKAGAKYSVHGGYITGENILLEKDALIVQTWRGMDWDKAEPDSIFIIRLMKKGKDVVLHAIHAGIPDKAVAGIEKGWHDHYWNPWKQHIAGKKITRPKM